MGWICREEKTGACDGVYTSYDDAEYALTYLEDAWKGSVWSIVNSKPGESVRGVFWRLPKMLGELESKYGMVQHK